MLDVLTGDATPSGSAEIPAPPSPGPPPPSFFLGGDVPTGASVGRSTAGTYSGERRVRSCLACAGSRCGGAPQAPGRGRDGDAGCGEAAAVLAVDSEPGEVEASHGDAGGGSRGDVGNRDAGGGAAAAVAMKGAGSSGSLAPRETGQGVQREVEVGWESVL
jgi:hypothetical protein